MNTRKTLLRNMIDAIMRGNKDDASSIMNEYATLTTRSVMEAKEIGVKKPKKAGDTGTEEEVCDDKDGDKDGDDKDADK